MHTKSSVMSHRVSDLTCEEVTHRCICAALAKVICEVGEIQLRVPLNK